MYPVNRQNRKVVFLGENHPFFLVTVVRLSITKETQGFYVFISSTQKENFMRGGYRGIPKPKLPSHLKRVHVNARIQKWMLDELKKQGEVGIVLEYILEKNAGFKYQPEK